MRLVDTFYVYKVLEFWNDVADYVITPSQCERFLGKLEMTNAGTAFVPCGDEVKKGLRMGGYLPPTYVPRSVRYATSCRCKQRGRMTV
jgi:hypothetical protein